MPDEHLYFPDGLPDDLLGLSPVDLLKALGRPTLVRVPGRGEAPPRGVATLLHGDESTGLEAMIRILRHPRTYAYDVYWVIGNVPAALAPPVFSHRYLDEQEDFNRIWGVDEPTTSQRLAADGILTTLRAAELEALVDVHNNTGSNPFYAIVTHDVPKDLNLATLFTTTILHWGLKANTLMEALPHGIPAIAVECGRPGRPESLAFAVDGLRRYLGEPRLVEDPVLRDYDLLGDLRKVTIRPEVRFRFGGEMDETVDFVVDARADECNFMRVPRGHVIGHARPGAALPLHARAPDGTDVTAAHFRMEADGRVVTTTSTTPVMMTRTEPAARKDCLFYLSHEFPPQLT